MKQEYVEDLEVSWFDDPTKYSYLRKSKRCEFYEEDLRNGGYSLPSYNDFQRGYKIIGFSKIKPENIYGDIIFSYHMYWLKDYDEGCPNEDEVPYRNGHAPVEAVKVIFRSSKKDKE